MTRGPRRSGLVVDWDRFANALQATMEARGINAHRLSWRLNLTHTMIGSAVHGRPVGTEPYLTLCDWMGADPLAFTALALLETMETPLAPLQANLEPLNPTGEAGAPNFPTGEGQ